MLKSVLLSLMNSFESKKYLSYAESGKEKREQPMKVTNILEELNLPRLLDLEKELNGENVIDLDNKALEKENCPFIVYGRPHVGEYIPNEILEKMNEGGKKISAILDRGTQEVFKTDDIPSVGFKISRFVVDMNRAPRLESSPENPLTPGKVLWYEPAIDDENEIDFKGKIYKEGQEPNGEEVQDLVEKFYLPYYNTMMGTIGSLTDRRESNDQRIFVIDGHSFPISENLDSYFESYGIKNSKELPLFILGDQDGEKCDEDIRESFAKSLEKRFYELPEKDQEFLLSKLKTNQIVGLNNPFKGVHNVSFYGAREQGINAIQLELNEAPLVDEINGNWFNFSYNERGIKLIKSIVHKASMDVDHLLKNN